MGNQSGLTAPESTNPDSEALHKGTSLERLHQENANAPVSQTWLDDTIAQADLSGFFFSLTERKRVLTCLLIAGCFAAMAAVARPGSFARIALICAGCSIFRGMYLLWADERNRFARVSAYLSKPDLRFSIASCCRYRLDGRNYLVAEVAVTNHSLAITTLRSARLELDVSGCDYRSVVYAGDSSFAAATWGRILPEGRQHSSPDLLRRLSSQCLEMGVLHAGVLAFPFDRLPELPRELHLSVSLEDAYGHTHRTKETLTFAGGAWQR